MTVGTLEEDGLTVDEELCILDFHLAESHTLGSALKHFALLAEECHLQGVEVGGFSRPLGRVFHIPFCRYPSVGSHCEGFFLDSAALIVRQAKFGTLTLGICRGERNVECGIAVSSIKVGSEVYVTDVRGWAGIEIAFACNTCKAPEILVLEIGTVAPTHHLHGNEVLLSGFDVAGEVELSGILGIFGISYPLAVDPHLDIRGGRTDVHDDLFAIPRCRNVESTAVGTRKVVLFLNERRIVLELCGPGIADILVDGFAIAVQFEECGNGKFVPFTVVVANSLEALRTEVVMTGKMELPFSFEREIACRTCFVVYQSLFGIFKGKERSVRGDDSTHTVLVGIEPVFLGGIGIVAGLCRCRIRCKGRGQQEGSENNRFHDIWMLKIR